MKLRLPSLILHFSFFLLPSSFFLFLSGCSQPNGGEARWPVMGTIAQVQWNDNKDVSLGNGLVTESVRFYFAEIEKLLNAHDPESELCRLAVLSDEEILAQCNPLVRPCYVAAFKLRDETGGVFNPRWRGQKTMDLGAIAKGFAVDLAAENFSSLRRDWGDWRILLDLGGNLKSVGTYGWRVGVKDGETFKLNPGEACATSAEYYRGKHIRDGRSGAECTNTVYSVTVVHPTSAMLADGLSTVCFLLGRERGERFLKEKYPGARAYWVTSQ